MLSSALGSTRITAILSLPAMSVTAEEVAKHNKDRGERRDRPLFHLLLVLFGVAGFQGMLRVLGMNLEMS